MRIVRTVAGLLLLTIGLPVLLVGGALWTAMQHRDSGGAFSASVEPVSSPGHAVVVTDLDTLLADDAPFARGADTRLRLTAGEGVFIGIAPVPDVAAYLAGAAYARVDGVSLARGPLPMRTTDVTGTGAPTAAPGTQSIWVRQGAGTLEWRPSDLRGQQLSLVMMNLDARAGVTVALRAAVSAGWLAPSAYGLLALGWLMVILGITLLAWPVRPREVVFVVEPDQVPAVSARLGVTPLSGLGAPVPVPPSGPPPRWPVPAAPTASGSSARPVTLADALASAGVRAPGPAPAWPPFNPPPVTPTLTWPASRPVSPAGPPAVWPVPPDLPRDELASRRQALAEAAGGRKMPVAGVSLDARPVSPAAPAAPAPSEGAGSAPAPKAAAPADAQVMTAGARSASAPAAASAGASSASGSAPAPTAESAGASAASAGAGSASAAAAAAPSDKAAAPSDKAAAPTGRSTPAGKAESSANGTGDEPTPKRRATDTAADDKPSLAEALSGWSLSVAKNGAEAEAPPAKRSLADLADAARRAARAVVSDGVTTLGTPEEPARLAPAAKPSETDAPTPARPARRRKTAAGLPAPDPAPSTAPTSLTLPKRPATRRRTTAPKQTAPANQAADETAKP